MTSRERILTALRGSQPDRVPVTLYEHSPFNNDWPNREPSYAPLIELEARLGDSFVAAPIDCPVFLGDPNVVRGSEEKQADGTVVIQTDIETPKGPLRAVSRRDPGLMTNWQIEPLIKTTEDVERVLAMPDPPGDVDADRLTDLEKQVGSEGVLTFSVGDAIGHVVSLYDFEEFVMTCYSDDGPIRALLERAQSQVLRAIERIGAVVENAVFRLWGPEYCGEPLMDPRVYFPRYVVEQDRTATDAIHRTGNLSVIHCHGKLRAILEMIKEIGADGLEPIETLPMATADVTMAEVKQTLGDRMCLMGGMQAQTLETSSADAVEAQAKEVIEAGAAGGGLILLPTSAPFMVPLTEKCLANFQTMFEAVHKYGQY